MSEATKPTRKDEIIDAALEVFSESGYEGGSMREIAKRVGVSEPALYRHFDGKEALFLALLRVGAGRVQGEARTMIAAIRPETVRSQILETLRDRRRAVSFYAPFLRTVLPVAARNERFLAEYRATIIDPMRETITEKAAEIDAALGVADADATRCARVRALLALVVGFMVSSLVLADEPDEAIVDAVLRVMQWDARA
jgi:AcrR family transcriptional regulator